MSQKFVSIKLPKLSKISKKSNPGERLAKCAKPLLVDQQIIGKDLRNRSIRAILDADDNGTVERYFL